MANEQFTNTVTIVGRAGSDAEIRYFDTGKAKATVSIAVNRYRGKQQDQMTDWFRVEFWERDAEIASEYIRKGQLILIEGRINMNQWTDSSTNEERIMYSITCTSFRLLGSKRENESYGGSMANNQSEEVPF